VVNSVCGQTGRLLAPMLTLETGVCTENLSSGVMVVKSAKDGA
jgi:hypothetical protein